MFKWRTSPRYFGSQKIKKYHAESVRNFAPINPRTCRYVKSLNHEMRAVACDGVLVGRLIDDQGYGPAFFIAGILHPIGFLLILLAVRRIEPVRAPA